MNEIREVLLRFPICAKLSVINSARIYWVLFLGPLTFTLPIHHLNLRTTQWLRVRVVRTSAFRSWDLRSSITMVDLFERWRRDVIHLERQTNFDATLPTDRKVYLAFTQVWRMTLGRWNCLEDVDDCLSTKSRVDQSVRMALGRWIFWRTSMIVLAKNKKIYAVPNDDHGI